MQPATKYRRKQIHIFKSWEAETKSIHLTKFHLLQINRISSGTYINLANEPLESREYAFKGGGGGKKIA